MSWDLSPQAKSCFDMWNNEGMACMFDHSTKKCCKIWKQLIKQIWMSYWNINHKGTHDSMTFLEWQSVAEQRVTGFFLLAGERMGTEMRINLAASFMSDGGFWSISESGRPSMHGLHGKICLDDGAWWVLVRRCIHEGAWGASKVAWGWSQARQLSRAVLRV